MVMDKPSINDGSDGKLVLIVINIEELSKAKPILHGMSNTTDPDTFMAAHHATLNGERTSDQSRALQKKIYGIQMKNYEKGLGKLTPEERRANGLLGYANGLALLTYEQRLAHFEKTLGLTKFYCPPPTITNDDEIHDLAKDDVVDQANFGTGTVISVYKPCPSQNYGRAQVKFDDEQVGTRPVSINSLSCNGKRCQFAKEYRLTTSWPKTEEVASAREFDWGKCSKCGMMGSCNDPQNPRKRRQHQICGGFFERQT